MTSLGMEIEADGHVQQLNEEEQKLFRLYGKLPNKKDLLQNKLKERKYFDSGDYAMSKAGKSDAGLVGGLGREHPSYVPKHNPFLIYPANALTLGSMCQFPDQTVSRTSPNRHRRAKAPLLLLHRNPWAQAPLSRLCILHPARDSQAVRSRSPRCCSAA